MKKVTPRFKMELVLSQGSVKIIEDTFYWTSNAVSEYVLSFPTKGVKLREFIAYVYEQLAVSKPSVTPEFGIITINKAEPVLEQDSVQSTISELDAILTSWTKLR